MSDRFSEKISRLYNSRELLWIIICIGIALRLIRYLHNPSLWFDESVYAVDFFTRSFPEFINPSLDYDHGFPYGFPILTKIAIQTFGYSEYAYRLFPLLFGIASILLFYRISRHYISPKAVPFALALFAISDPLIMFSSELKPYSCDVAVALLLYAVTIHVQSKKLDLPDIVLYAFTGAFVIWLSNPSVFILAGLGTCLVVSALNNKDWSRIRRLSIVFLGWALSFGVYYMMFIQKSYANISMGPEELLKLEFAYMPVPPRSLADIKWFIDCFFETFNFPVGLSVTGVAAFTFLIGCMSLYSEKKEKFYMLLSPVLLTLLASAMHKYPFKGRLILFLVPLMLLFIAEGARKIRDSTTNSTAMIGTVLIGILFIYPVSWAAYHAKNPVSRAEIKPVITHIKDNWQDGDIVYVYFYSQYAFKYYSEIHPGPYRFEQDQYIKGIAPRRWYTRWRKEFASEYYDPDQAIEQSAADVFREYIKDLDKLKGYKRVWLLFTEGYARDGIREEKLYKYHLENIGKLQDTFGRSGLAITYLYEMNGPEPVVGNE